MASIEYIRDKLLCTATLLVLFFAIGTPAHANLNINIAPISVNFGNQTVGSSSAPVKMTLTNATRHKASIVNISSPMAQFSYSWPSLPFTLNPGQKLTGSVTFTPAALQTYKGTLTFSTANGLITVVSLTGMGGQAQPLVAIQPATEMVAAGQSASFLASTSGVKPLGYQWKKNGATISGATSSAYTTPPTTTSDNGAQFTAIISTSTGSTSSNPATLTVIAAAVAPSITSQPVSQTVTAGLAATFSAAATGTAPLSYQWKKSGSSITGATSPTYSTPATAASDNRAPFTVVVSNTAGTVTSNVATLTVNAAPVAPAITTQPASQTVTAGQAASFSVAASGTAPLTYQWKKNGTPIAGATSSTYTTPATTTSDTGSQFTVAVSNAGGNVTSSAATLTINAAPVAPAITTQPASQTVTAGQATSFSVAASGTAPLTFQWKKNGTPITGATSSTYTTPAMTASDTGSQFTATASNAAGNVTSSAATLTVNAPPGQLTASASTLSFGNVNVGISSSQSVTFTNSGTTNITVSNVSFSGAGFNVSGLSSGLILSSGQIATLNVSFAPAAIGSVTGSITISSDAANSPASISLSGTGIVVTSGGNATPSAFFGMHLIDYTNYPNVPVGALGKGTGVNWAYIEQTQGVFNWSRLDAFVNTAQNNGVDFFYSNDGVPPWAAADRTTCTYTLAYGAGTGCLGMISNISYWDDFVTALVTRYKGKIKIYELWNEPSNPDESVISTADMVTLTTHEYNIIRSIDPAATIVNPSYTVGTDLDAYFAAGGVKTIDVMSLHAYPDARGDAELLTRSWVSSVRQVMAKYGLSSKPLWDTEGGWGTGVTDPDLRAAFVARYLLLGWSRGLPRMYWYAWDNSQFGTLFTPGQPESKAAIAYQQVYNWMLGATMPSQCTSSGGYESNGDYIYTPSFYTCVLTRSGGYSAQVVWQTSSDSTLTTVYTVPSQYTQYRDLNGNTFPVPSNRLLTIGNKPILLE